MGPLGSQVLNIVWDRFAQSMLLPSCWRLEVDYAHNLPILPFYVIWCGMPSLCCLSCHTVLELQICISDRWHCVLASAKRLFCCGVEVRLLHLSRIQGGSCILFLSSATIKCEGELELSSNIPCWTGFDVFLDNQWTSEHYPWGKLLCWCGTAPLEALGVEGMTLDCLSKDQTHMKNVASDFRLAHLVLLQTKHEGPCPAAMGPWPILLQNADCAMQKKHVLPT